jgi:hypothetical protein
MRIKTARDLATSLQGSAFRRMTRDGRTRYVRAIGTMTQLSRRRDPRTAQGAGFAGAGGTGLR